MTGIPTVNEIRGITVLIYDIFIICCIVGFAAYDLRHLRVPDRALVLFCPVVLAAPCFHAPPLFYPENLFLTIGVSFAGAATGFSILLLAALLSKSGAGIGGGDIKLTALMGFVYGPYRILAILLISSALALISALTIKKRNPNTPLALPFVPFLALGTLIVTITNIFSK